VRFVADTAYSVLVSTAESQTPRVQVQEVPHQTAGNPQTSVPNTKFFLRLLRLAVDLNGFIVVNGLVLNSNVSETTAEAPLAFPFTPPFVFDVDCVGVN